MAGSLLATAAWSPEVQAQQAATRGYNIPAGPLSSVLTQYAGETRDLQRELLPLRVSGQGQIVGRQVDAQPVALQKAAAENRQCRAPSACD